MSHQAQAELHIIKDDEKHSLCAMQRSWHYIMFCVMQPVAIWANQSKAYSDCAQIMRDSCMAYAYILMHIQQTMAHPHIQAKFQYMYMHMGTYYKSLLYFIRSYQKKTYAVYHNKTIFTCSMCVKMKLWLSESGEKSICRGGKKCHHRYSALTTGRAAQHRSTECPAKFQYYTLCFTFLSITARVQGSFTPHFQAAALVLSVRHIPGMLSVFYLIFFIQYVFTSSS